MRKILLAAAMLFSANAAQAATVVNVRATGTITGEKYTILCTSASGPDCLAQNPGGSLREIVTFDVDTLNVPVLINGDGTYTFQRSPFGSRESITATFQNIGGVFTGLTLRYMDDTCGPFGRVGCYYLQGSTTTFNVTGGIPEPSTWLMMLLGFAAIGSGLRRRNVVALSAN